MYSLPAHLLVFFAASLDFHVSWAAPSSSQTSRLSWQCFPRNVVLFADFACSLNGPSFLVTKHDPSNHVTSGLQPRPTVEFNPWSYEPVCTGVIEEIGSELCVYTSVEYAGGRGVSIVTVPKIAEKFAALLPFKHSTALDGVLLTGHVRVTPKTQSKGRTALARQNLKGGDDLASNVPIVVQSHALDELSRPESEELLRVAVLRLPVATQRLLAGLTSETHPDFIISGFIDYHGGFPINVGGHNHYAIFPELSYFNHACAPNSQVHIDLSTLRTSVQAARNISQGKEITISYFYPETRKNHFKTFKDRQRTIEDYLRFTCSCSRCRAGTRADEGLQHLHRQQQALDDWSPGASVTPDDALSLIRRYKREGFETFLDIPYLHAALAYNAIGDAHKAQKYAGLAANLLVLKGLDGDPSFETCQQLLQYPRQHWSWRRRIDD